MTEPTLPLDEPKHVVATIPKDQKFSYRITPISGGWMNAEMIGQQITAIAKLMRIAGGEEGPRVAVVLIGASMLKERVIEFQFAVLPYKDQSISRNRKRKKK